MFERIIFIIEILAVITYGITGVMEAKKHHLDMFGVLVIGCITAVGGGLLRDIMIGIIPPLMFTTPIYVIVAFITSLIAFVLLYSHKTNNIHINKKVYDAVFNSLDSFGLAIISTAGVMRAFEKYPNRSIFVCIFAGLITGIGGGLIRDIMLNEIPKILRKRVYAVASIFCSLLFYVLFVMLNCDIVSSTIICILFTLIIRFLAIKYEWNLPSL